MQVSPYDTIYQGEATLFQEMISIQNSQWIVVSNFINFVYFPVAYTLSILTHAALKTIVPGNAAC